MGLDGFSDLSQLPLRTDSNTHVRLVLLLGLPKGVRMVQGQAPGAPKGMRMARGPDGSKGFAPGRGRPLPPQPAASMAASAPGSVRIFCLIIHSQGPAN